MTFMSLVMSLYMINPYIMYVEKIVLCCCTARSVAADGLLRVARGPLKKSKKKRCGFTPGLRLLPPVIYAQPKLTKRAREHATGHILHVIVAQRSKKTPLV